MHQVTWPRNKYDILWEKRLEMLIRFVELYQRIPRKGEEFEGFNIGNWVYTNRREITTNKIYPIRLQKLNNLKCFFDRNKRGYREKQWLEKLQILIEFKKSYNRWPKPTERYKGVFLGDWLYRNRLEYYKKTILPQRLKKLKDTGYVFQPLRKSDNYWDEFFGYLKIYIERHPENWYPNRVVLPKSERLSAWCKEMIKRHRIGTLKKDQRGKLEAIHFPFNQTKSHQDRFEKQLKFIHQFHHFHPNKPLLATTEFPKGNRLGQWCCYIRIRKKYLSKDQIERLDKLNFKWNLYEERWDTQFYETITFYKKYSELPKSRINASKKELKLASWIKSQRKFIRESTLPYDKICKLTPLLSKK